MLGQCHPPVVRSDLALLTYCDLPNKLANSSVPLLLVGRPDRLESRRKGEKKSISLSVDSKTKRRHAA